MAKSANTVEITTDPDTKEIVFTLVGADESGAPRSLQRVLARVKNGPSVERLKTMYHNKRKFRVKDKRNSFKEYYYSKKRNLTEDDKEKDDNGKGKKIKDDGGREFGPLDEDNDHDERMGFIKDRTDELATQYIKKGLKSIDAIRAAHAQAEREWDNKSEDAIKAVKDTYRTKRGN